MFFTAKKHYVAIIAFAFILLLGIFLRFDKLNTVPRHGATFDEFAWTWLGINLIQKGVPISWSPHPQYKDVEEIRYQGAAFLIVRPYLEHPPFFGLVAGSFAILNGAKDMYDVTLSKIRPLALLLGSFSIFMVFLLAKDVYGLKVGLFSSLIYATVPTVVIGSRIVQNENFLIPFWLLSLYLIHKYLKTGKKRFRNIAAILAGILSLAKVPWLVVGLSLSMILSFKNKWRDALIVGSIVASVFSFYIFYGVYFDKNLFIDILKLQTSRYDISFSGFFSVFINPLLTDRYYLDGWILFGWFSMVLLLKDLKNHFLILIPFVAYLLVFIFAIPDEAGHGWYRYPFYQFLLISSAIALIEEFKKISFVSLLFILTVGLSLLNNTWNETFGFSYVVYRLFILAAAASVILPLWKKIQNNYLKIPVVFIWFLIFIVLNIWSVFSYIDK